MLGVKHGPICIGKISDTMKQLVFAVFSCILHTQLYLNMTRRMLELMGNFQDGGTEKRR